MPDRRSVTLIDVAQLAGVSKGLASRILNRDPTVRAKEATKAEVYAAAERLGYVPNSAARALRKARSRTLGLVLNVAASPMYLDVVNAAQAHAADHGYFILLIDADEIIDDPSMFHDVVAARRVDGLILQGGYGGNARLLEPFAELVPSVFFNSSGTSAVPGIRLQDEQAAAMLTKHLLELGHRRIGFVAGPAGETSDRREAGFLEVMHAHAEAEPEILNGSWTADDCHAEVRAYLSSGGQATAFIAVNVMAGAGVLSAAHAQGIAVPRQISVTAIHDSWFARHLTPALTTAKLPLAELGTAAVQAMIDQLEGRMFRSMLISHAPELVQRSSTAAV